MKILIYISIIIFLFYKGNCAEATISAGSDINYITQRISSQIKQFQSENKDYLKQLILKKIIRPDLETYLKDLEIVVEPNFYFDTDLLHILKKDSLETGFHFPTHMAPLFQFTVSNKDSSIYKYFEKPEIDTDNVMISFRIYDKNENLTDYMEIYEYRNFEYNNPKAKLQKERPIYKRLHLTDTTNMLVVSNKCYYDMSIEAKVFSLKINSLVLYRCIIYGNSIYSIECLRRLFPKDKIEEILKYPKEKTCGCDVDNYLKYVKE